ncbi:MAG: type II CAAX endopeptidase family protein [Candidatus Neomarinimicrobiota bacterium]
MTNLTDEKVALEDRQRVRFAFLATIGSLLVVFAVGLLAMELFLWLRPSDPADVDLPRWAILIGEGLIIVPLVFFLRRSGMPLRETLRLKKVNAPTIWSALLIGLGVSVLIDEVDRLIAMVFPMPESVQGSMEFLVFAGPADALLVIAGAVIMAPVVEEAVFRGFLQGQLERGYRDATKAVLFSSLLFMLLHFNPWWGLQIYIFGMVLGYLAWRTGNIWPAIVVHGTNNALSLMVANVDADSLEWYVSGEHVSPGWLVAAAGLAYIGFRLLFGVIPIPVKCDREGGKSE